MGDHTTEIVIFFFGSALLLGIEAMKMSGWRAYLFWALGGIFVGCGAFWTLIRELSPPVTAFVTSVATNPETWFILAVLLILVLAVSGRPKTTNTFQLQASGIPDISTPELGRDLRGEISALEKSLSGRISMLTGMVSKLQYETAIDYPNAETVAEAFQNLDQAVAAKIARISEETQSFPELIKSLERDSARLLFFAADLATLAVLEWQIAEGSRFAIPLGPSVEMEARNAQSAGATRFIHEVRSSYANTHRGISVENVLHHAEQEAEESLRNPSQRPTYIDVLDYRNLKIAETRRMRLLAFLKYERGEKEAEIRRQRPDLLERLTARNSN